MKNLKRVFSFAVTDFYRNKGISLSAIFVLGITVLLVTGLFLLQGVSNSLIATIQDKIDITAYFKQDVPEEDILSVKDEILKTSSNIKEVEYVSREDALEEFIEKHKDSDAFSQALSEVGDNPFLPSLNITTDGSPSSFEEVSKILEAEKFKGIIEKVDFLQKKDTIEKIFSVTSGINRFGLALSFVLLLVALAVVFNTVKLIIDGSKEEISTMKIVGASNWFVRAPFVIEGVIFGLIAFVICFFITIVAVYLISSPLSSIVPGFNLFKYFISNFWVIVLIQLVSGGGLGALFSFIAVRKYLKI